MPLLVHEQIYFYITWTLRDSVFKTLMTPEWLEVHAWYYTPHAVLNNNTVWKKLAVKISDFYRKLMSWSLASHCPFYLQHRFLDNNTLLRLPDKVFCHLTSLAVMWVHVWMMVYYTASFTEQSLQNEFCNDTSRKNKSANERFSLPSYTNLQNY